jgi:hypothetical protein
MNHIREAAEFTRHNEMERVNTVEQLRRCLLRANDPAWNKVVDSLISAAHAEGVAEERERILEVADRVSVGSPVADMAGTHDYISTEPRSSRDRNREAPISRAIRGFVDSESLCENGGEATGEGRARASVNIFIVPASVLAPTKETDND